MYRMMAGAIIFLLLMNLATVCFADANTNDGVENTIKDVKELQSNVKDIMKKMFPDSVKSVTVEGVTKSIAAKSLALVAFAREILLIVIMLVGIIGMVKLLFSFFNPIGRRTGIYMVVVSFIAYAFVKYAPLIYLKLSSL